MGKIFCWTLIDGVGVKSPRCSNNSCRVECSSSPDGFCCIDHSSVERSLQVLGLEFNQPPLGIDICNSEADCNNWGYFAKIVNTTKFQYYNCISKTFTAYRSVPYGTVSISESPTAGRPNVFECGATIRFMDFTANPSGDQFLKWAGDNVIASVIRAPFLPTETETN